jgi:hypothetical protein
MRAWAHSTLLNPSRTIDETSFVELAAQEQLLPQ